MRRTIAEVLSNEGLNEQYKARPPYQQNDYIGWIIKAKRAETRQKRLKQMLEELKAGDTYMGRPISRKNKIKP